MLDAAVALDLAVAAVVVRDEEAFAGDQLAGAAGAEQDDGVLQGGLVHAVDVLRRQAETLGLHVGYPLGNKRRQPHPFVGPDWQEKQKGKQYDH